MTSELFYQQTLEYLILHNNNFYRSLPTNVQFTKLKALSLFDNWLSCQIPSQFINSSDNTNLKLMILPSNWFECGANQAKWMRQSLFLQSFALFVSKFNIIKSYSIGITTIVFSIILSIYFIMINIGRDHRMRFNSRFTSMSSKMPIANRKYAEADLNSMGLHFSQITNYIHGNSASVFFSMILTLIYAVTP
eukprot:246765_1